MRCLCNIGDCLLTSGICAWRVALQGRSQEGETVAGGRNFRSSDKNLCLPQLFFLPPVTGFSVTLKQANGHKRKMLPPSATTKRKL